MTVASADQPSPARPPLQKDQTRPPRSSGPVMRLEMRCERASMIAASSVTVATTAQAKMPGSKLLVAFHIWRSSVPVQDTAPDVRQRPRTRLPRVRGEKELRIAGDGNP